MWLHLSDPPTFDLRGISLRNFHLRNRRLRKIIRLPANPVKRSWMLPVARKGKWLPFDTEVSPLLECLGIPACFRTALAVWRDTMLWSTGKRLPVIGFPRRTGRAIAKPSLQSRSGDGTRPTVRWTILLTEAEARRILNCERATFSLQTFDLPWFASSCEARSGGRSITNCFSRCHSAFDLAISSVESIPFVDREGEFDERSEKTFL